MIEQILAPGNTTDILLAKIRKSISHLWILSIHIQEYFMRRSLQQIFALVVLLVFSFIIFPSQALASTPLKSQFTTALGACEAVASIKKGTNPGNVRLKPGQTYQIVGQNQDNPSHYLLEIASASPSRRWVPISCVSADGLPSDTTGKIPPVIPVAVGNDYLLAVSWQPAFCESKPEKTECKNLAKNPNRPEATNFALHGLWPQPESNIYCGVSQGDITFDKASAWSKLPPIETELSPETWERLQVVMPGTASNLQRHEWIKHGTCYQGTPEEYFTESIALINALNKSPIQALVASNIGRQVTLKDIDQALSSFAADAGDKTEVKCKDLVLGELWFNLRGNITPNTLINDLLTNSPKAKLEKFKSCLIDDARN
ncbi:ribonuclease [Nostoc sp. LEGE 06077]|uniref:ribonuclease T2 family protein n=1 Tax=Nostoc sp. LEGE 06077 TaxID=915325 RepID=UPI0018823191|nr:ribonuclease [Nostoc sp. LEGE 06077]MBE9207867.1 ribonuclease [Nostoc sp. LEGE 06077]